MTTTTTTTMNPGGDRVRDRATRLRQLYRDAALIPYRLSTLEQESRQAEQVGHCACVSHAALCVFGYFYAIYLTLLLTLPSPRVCITQALVQAWQMKNAQRSLHSQRAKHPYPQLDVHFLALSVPAANPYAIASSSAMTLEPLARAGRGGGGRGSGGLLQSLFPRATITPANLLHLDPHAAGTTPHLLDTLPSLLSFSSSSSSSSSSSCYTPFDNYLRHTLSYPL